jgi:hypothetical protein
LAVEEASAPPRAVWAGARGFGFGFPLFGWKRALPAALGRAEPGFATDRGKGTGGDAQSGVCAQIASC